ncbi:hypothetical protein Y032_0122g1092 [Ancylostoma ceylanicum]|uniref:Uncharacterized protein n=1 Tax=Ancylostoma ceylanicum TaxID=53326 RepID=A0A016T986_9BILA|nr:hypothetical protein Y032_0122g1092 [Ancylostoma ceylanicum]
MSTNRKILTTHGPQSTRKIDTVKHVANSVCTNDERTPLSPPAQLTSPHSSLALGTHPLIRRSDQSVER